MRFARSKGPESGRADFAFNNVKLTISYKNQVKADRYDSLVDAVLSQPFVEEQRGTFQSTHHAGDTSLKFEIKNNQYFVLLSAKVKEHANTSHSTRRCRFCVLREATNLEGGKRQAAPQQPLASSWPCEERHDDDVCIEQEAIAVDPNMADERLLWVVVYR